MLLFASFIVMSVFNYAANPAANEATVENIKAAITGESTASAKYAAYAKKVTIKLLYQNALDQLNAGKQESLPNKYIICTTCGNTYDSEAHARCGISMTPKDRFITIE